MRVEVPGITIGTSLAVHTAAMNLHLSCVMNYTGESRVSSMEIADEDIIQWWYARDEFKWELRKLGVPAQKSRDIVLQIWRVLEPLKDTVKSTRRSFLERTT